MNRNGLVGAVLVLLAAAPVWAGGVKEPNMDSQFCWVQPPGSALWYPCDSEEAKIADCLNLMELAMKAVDPYLDNMSLPEKERERVLKRWERAKNSCWSDLKDKQIQHYH
jgi:hypothetical protein